MKRLLVRTLSGIIYVTLMVLALYFQAVYYVLFLAFVIFGVYEYSKMTTSAGDKPLVVYWMILAILAFFTIGNYDLCKGKLICDSLFGLALLGFPIFVVLRKWSNPVDDLASGLLALAWIVLPLACMGIWTRATSPATVLSFLILIWGSDTFAYLGGTLFGSLKKYKVHKLCPNISPGKTWEGSITGLIMSVGISIAFYFIPFFHNAAPYFLIGHWIIFAVLTVIFGTFGDLLESKFKRQAGLKDSGKIMPGHGGILDRFDSILLGIYPAMVWDMLWAGLLI